MIMKDPVFAAIDLSGIIPGIEGIIGYPLFRRSVVEIESRIESVRIYPRNTNVMDEFRWEDLLVAKRHAYIACRFEGDREGLFCLDTGHRGAVTFHTPSVFKYDLLEGRVTRKSSGTGVGGQSSKRCGPIDWFEIGGERFAELQVAYATTPNGGFSDPYAVGHVGMGLLKQFKIMIDYSTGKIAFVR